MYLEKVIQGRKASTSSKETARPFRVDPSKHYRARSIRKWAVDFLETGVLTTNLMIRHQKKVSIFAEHDVREASVAWLRADKYAMRSTPRLRNQLQKLFLPTLFESLEDGEEVVEDADYTLLNNSISTYLKDWGFEFKNGNSSF
ncbi:hypothetical protein BDB01DRAFT_837786 [Pilobolus umbonatus]|nr:hypothetical protein BDB01DRAFT_837786 [Pilobolus umbonatus]